MAASKPTQSGAVAVVPREAPKSLWSWDPIGEMDRMLRSNALVPSFPSLGKPYVNCRSWLSSVAGSLALMSKNFTHFTCHVCTSLSNIGSSDHAGLGLDLSKTLDTSMMKVVISYC